jgi:hypothetical protein
MKVDFWKAATIFLVCVLCGLTYSGRKAAAQSGSGYHITRMTSIYGSLSVSGEVKGFSCGSNVDGMLDKGTGSISTDVTCYVLSRD